MYKKEHLIYKRPRIFNLLAANAAVTTITAGSGYGKTQAVRSYLEQCGTDSALITLTSLDNYIQHFWEALTYALSPDNKEIQNKLIQIGFPDDANTLFQFIELLKNNLTHIEDFILAFDNYHLIINADIQNFIENLILADIRGLSFIFISRTPIAFSIHCKFHRKVNTLTAKELSFTTDEMTSYFNEQGISLDKRNMSLLEKYTNGWTISVNLAAKILMNNAKEDDQRKLIELFEHDIFSVLEFQLFNKYSDEELESISLLSLLDFFSDSFAANLLASENLWQHVMADLLICTDEHKGLYQFHELFRSYLSHRALVTDTEKSNTFYLTAGQWYQENGYKIAALKCFRNIQAYSQCLEVMDSFFPYRFADDTAKLLQEVIEDFSPEFRQNHPVIDVLYAVLHFMTLEYAKLETILNQIILKYKDDCNTPEKQAVLCDTYTAYALLYMAYGDTSFKEFLEKAAQYSTSGSTVFGQNFMILNNGHSITLKQFRRGEIADWVTALLTSEDLIISLLHCGHGFANLAQAEASYLKGNMNDALLYTNRALEQGRNSKQTDVVCSCYTLLNKIAVAQGQYREAAQALDNMQEFLHPLQLPVSFHLPDTSQNWFYTKMRLLDKVPGWNSGEPFLLHNKYLITIGMERVIYAECLLLEKRYDELLQNLETTIDIFTTRNLLLPLISVYVLQAIAYDKLDDSEHSCQALLNAYEKAYMNDIRLPIIEYGAFVCSVTERIKKLPYNIIPAHWLNTIYHEAAAYESNASLLRTESLNEINPK